jgi:SAM-dependent methyltransferase
MNRQELFRHLIQRNGYESYLEIGCETDKTFAHVDLRRKVGIDPKRGGTVRMTSDAFFAQNRDSFDLVFVDGLHLCEQVLRDVENAARCLTIGGCIVLHDCLPTARDQQLREPIRPGTPWTGDVWKAVVELRQRAEYDIAVLGSDWGLGVLFVRPNSDRLQPPAKLDWEEYSADRVRLLRIVDDAGIKRFIDGEPVKGAERRSLGLRNVLQQFHKQTPIDVLLAHVTMGSPSLLFDEFDFPIVTYIEFPSFRLHGWDERYPPPEGQ